jgi:hypothetical protein
MNRLSRLIALVADVSAVIIVISSKSVRQWINSHGLVVLYVRISVFIIGTLLFEVLDRRYKKVSDDLRRTQQSLAAAENAIRKIEAVTTEQHHRSVDPQDQVSINRLVKHWPLVDEAVSYLRTQFTGKQWRWKDLNNLFAFADELQAVSFDEAKLESARRELLALLTAFGLALQSQSHPIGSGSAVARLNVAEEDFAARESIRVDLLSGANQVVEAYAAFRRQIQSHLS